jgi:hypothetical protein
LEPNCIAVAMVPLRDVGCGAIERFNCGGNVLLQPIPVDQSKRDSA